MMKTATLLLTVLACGAALAMPAASGAWLPESEEDTTMHAYATDFALQVPLHYNGTIYLGDMYVVCPDAELFFRYSEASLTHDNPMSNGTIGPDNGYCDPQWSGSGILDNCVIGGTTTSVGMNAYGDASTDEIVISNGPHFGLQFQGAQCPFVSDTFYVSIPDTDSCRPAYSDFWGTIDFYELECLETQESIMPHIRDDEPVEIEGLFGIYDPVDPFPYME
jgi:hypothetical protein